ALEGARGGAGARRRFGVPVMRGLAVLLGLAPGRRAGLLGRGQVNPSAARLRQADGDGLLGRAHAVLAFAHVVDFLAHEFARLGGWGLALLLVARGALQRFPFRHDNLLACVSEARPGDAGEAAPTELVTPLYALRGILCVRMDCRS
ncbi:hypothetical protein HMPREF0005_03844, partial [Achromobacter xylosoxidans C54]